MHNNLQFKAIHFLLIKSWVCGIRRIGNPNFATMKRIVFMVLLLTGVLGRLNAQELYKNAIGLRLNGGAGITVRHYLDGQKSLEGILYTRWHGMNVCGLLQANYPVFTEPGFRFYMGAGGHIGAWDTYYSPWWDEDKHHTRFIAGVDGQIGLEYKFQEIPLNLSIDWKPAINIIGHANFWADDFAVSVRYVID